MTRQRALCEIYERGRTLHGNGLEIGCYLAVVSCEELPQDVHRDHHMVVRGYGAGVGQWFFFTAQEPAVAFGRAARMSTDCRGYGVYEAAQECLFCPVHELDEVVLLVAGENLDRRDDEVETFKRFVQAVKERPWSSGWHSPSGYVSSYNGGNSVRTHVRSLPL